MKNKFIIGFFVLLLSCHIVKANPGTKEGGAIFTAQCSGCHDAKIQVVGPALADVDKRHSMDWILHFVQSSQTMIKKNDKDAVALFNRYHVVMPDHPEMTADQIKGIVAYINEQSVDNSKSDQVALERPLEKTQSNYVPLSFGNDYGVFIIYILAVTVLIIALLFLVRLKELERKK